MIYSNACAYAIRAMTRLASIRPDGYVLLDDLCEEADLPRHFVAKVFQDLVRKGLLVSAKGRGGGFALSRPPEEITLYEIVAEVDGTDSFDQCVVGMARCNDDQPCPLHDAWKEVRGTIKAFLKETTLTEMAQSFERKCELIGLELPEASTESKPLKRRSS